MSDNILKIISSTVEFLPPSHIIDRTIDFLKKSFPDADAIDAKIWDDIQFVDAGANLEKVYCPNCGKEIDIAWWQEAMDNAYKSKFLNLEVVLPCCGTKSTLNHLIYERASGFARFVLEVRNPGKDMDNEKKESLQSLLDTQILPIWALY